MTSDPSTCFKCGGALTRGFLPDTTYGGTTTGSWHPGNPHKSFWQGVKTAKDEMLPLAAFRCSRCSAIELYADARFAADG